MHVGSSLPGLCGRLELLWTPTGTCRVGLGFRQNIVVECEVATLQEITVETLEEFATSFRALLGEDLFRRMLDGYDSGDAKGMTDHVQREGKAHPFAIAWDDLVKGAARSREAGVFSLSEKAYMLLDTLHSLSVAADDPDFDSLLRRLSGRDQFYSTAFEAFVLSAYRAAEVPVALIPEAAVAGERRPDLISKLPDGEVVFLECKSLQDDVRLEERVWSEIEARIGRALDASPLSLRVQIEASKRISHSDAATVVGAVADLIGNFPRLRGAEVADCEVWIDQIMAPGDVLRLPLNFPHSESGRLWAEATIDKQANEVRKLWLVETKPYPDTEQGDRLVRLFRDAASQLPRGSPGVVHLQVPYRAAPHFLDVVDRARPLLEREIARRQHVCAAVISGRFLNKRMAIEGNPIETSHVVIPNFAGTQRLPSGFRVLGAEDGTEVLRRAKEVDMSHLPGGGFDVLSEGTFLMQFSINEPLADQPGRYQFRHCSDDGLRQLSVWQTYGNRFRIEVVHSSFGRRELTLDLNHLEVGVDHKMCFTWSRDGIRVALNGDLLSRAAP